MEVRDPPAQGHVHTALMHFRLLVVQLSVNTFELFMKPGNPLLGCVSLITPSCLQHPPNELLDCKRPNHSILCVYVCVCVCVIEFY